MLDTNSIELKSEEISSILKSLAHPTRLKILCHVLDDEKSVNDLTSYCGIAQSAMSQFLGRMRDEGVLTSRREAQHIYYRIADGNLVKLLKALKEIYCP